MLGNDQSHTNEKQSFTTRTVPPVQHVAGAVEVTGAEVEAEVGAGHDHTLDLQDHQQGHDLAREVHIEAGIEVGEVWTCVGKDGHLEVEVDHSAHEYCINS